MVKFTLKCTEIQNFDDVMSDPLLCSMLHLETQQCDFYCVLKCNTICMHPLLHGAMCIPYRCTYTLIVVFKSMQYTQPFTQCRKIYATPDTMWTWQAHFRSTLIWIHALMLRAPMIIHAAASKAEFYVLF